MKPRTTRRIDGRAVSRREFDRLRAALRGKEGWYCHKTSTGGETGWNARDAAGVAYAFKAVQDGGASALEIRRLES